MIGQFKNKRIKIQISQFAKSTKIKVSKIIKLQLKKHGVAMVMGRQVVTAKVLYMQMLNICINSKT